MLAHRIEKRIIDDQVCGKDHRWTRGQEPVRSHSRSTMLEMECSGRSCQRFFNKGQYLRQGGGGEGGGPSSCGHVQAQECPTLDCDCSLRRNIGCRSVPQLMWCDIEFTVPRMVHDALLAREETLIAYCAPTSSLLRE